VRRPSGRMSDTELLGALRRGDEAAFAVLCARYESALRRYARHVLRARPALVDDVVQEALLRAHRALRRDDRHIEVRPYLFRLVRNCCLDELARVRTDSVPLHLLVAGDEPAAGGPSVESAFEQRSRVASTLGDLAALPEEQRHALVRREIDGLTHEQVAAELGITPGASRSLVYRAREALTRADSAREARCEDIRFALLRAHDARRRAPVSALKHVAGCSGCRAFRTGLKHNRAMLRVLVPGPLVLLGAVGALKGGGGLAAALKAGAARPVATGAAALLLAGGAAYELDQHVFAPGDRTPIPLSGVALPGGRLASGAPLPAHTALVTARAAAAATSAQLSCPAGMRVAGLVPAPGEQRSLGFAPETVVGDSTTAHVLFGAGTEPVDLAVLCRVPSSTGSVRASSSAAAAAHQLIVHACRRRTTLTTSPGGPASGTVTASEPLSILAGRSGWLRVRTDAGRNGWIPARVAC
jgi:RNA polymerase sigma factor (sigma-70 family)